MTSETGSGRAARRSQAVRRNHRRAMLRIGFGFLLSPPVLELAITAVIGLAALVGLARENQARSVARFAAWDKAQTLRRQGAAKIRSA
jgi:hypothetical protein